MAVKRGDARSREVESTRRTCRRTDSSGMGDAHLREVESVQSTCNRTDSHRKERCASERWGACDAPVGGQTDGGGKGGRGCASERRRACNAPVAKPIVVERGDACQREVESVQRTCSWTDSGRVYNRGRGDQ